MESKLAELLCGYSLELKRGDLTLIRGEACAIPLIRACYRAALKMGAYPSVQISYPEQSADLFKYGETHQFQYISEIDKVQADVLNAQITIDSTSNAKQLTGANPADIALFQQAKGSLRQRMFDREEKGSFKWIIAPYPTHSMAQEAEMSFEEYSEFVFNACKLHLDEPIKAWQAVGAFQEGIKNLLSVGSVLRIVGERTDLTVDFSGRIWRNSCGHRNMPDGEVFTSPLSANGSIYFDIPANYNGVEAVGVYLEFEQGRVVRAEAQKGGNFLLKMLDLDEGARFIGEIAFGLNDNITRPTKNILFDEKIGKTIHLAVGAAYKEAGGTNISGLHWDLIKDMRKDAYVELDGKLIYKDGNFKLNQ
ncbi:MAG: aminopeptidase [Deferribacteraceae bacterium]|jgi:aminopeptidase|nr:aminopeptidase [Deferribacteraceae bacterium]